MNAILEAVVSAMHRAMLATRAAANLPAPARQSAALRNHGRRHYEGEFSESGAKGEKVIQSHSVHSCPKTPQIPGLRLILRPTNRLPGSALQFICASHAGRALAVGRTTHNLMSRGGAGVPTGFGEAVDNPIPKGPLRGPTQLHKEGPAKWQRSSVSISAPPIPASP